MPLRQIVSCIKSPTYKLSKFINEILTPIANKEGYSVKNSYEFVERIRNTEVPPGYIMISLDIVALFPNIPRALALEIVIEQWNQIENHTSIGKELFLSMLKHCLDHSRFVYKDQCYIELDGMPMGGPLSPVIAELVTNHALTKIIASLDVELICLTKYVDDIFCLVPENSVDYVLNKFNAFHPKLQFTVELEKDGSIAYLDTYITRQETKMWSMWYKKPIASDRMLNYHSNHTLQQKIATAIGFIKRVQRLTTFENSNIRMIVFSRLRMNGFPTGLINTLWHKHGMQHNINDLPLTIENIPNSNTDENLEQKIIYKSIMYVRRVSERIKSLLKPIPHLRISYKSNHSVSSIHTQLKDKVPKLMDSCVVYSIPCECGLTYIGKTTQRLKDRIYQHKLSTRKEYDGPENEPTALVTHAKKGHNFQFDSTEIIDRCENDDQLEFLESCYIQMTKSKNVNKRTDTDIINGSYKSILYRLKERDNHIQNETFHSCQSSPPADRGG
ncbi:hypothetical protein DMENIID0001_016650 [Sergentomyia squamirostris]